MFVLAQLLGLFFFDFYHNSGNKLPYGLAEQQEIKEIPGFQIQILLSMVISFVIAVALILFLVRTNSVWFMKAWFFLVYTLAFGIAVSVLTLSLKIPYASFVALAVAVILTYLKLFRRNIVVHNLTEIILYPAIASIFIGLFNLTFMIIILIGISIYDIWAVWHSGVMQKMAKFQINKLGVMGGFFIPYASKEIKEKIKLLKIKYKNNIPEKVIQRSKLRVNVAMLGGGDVVFPIITAGVFLKTTQNLYSTLFVILFATLALIYLLIFAKKKRYYPAMPYLTAGLFLGMLVGWLFSLLF